MFTIYSIYHPGWGEGSESDNLYQVHLQLVNQSICNHFLQLFFDEDSMICAGDAETGVRSTCEVSHQHVETSKKTTTFKEES